MNWKRNQKYLPRLRHLYGLFFENGCCYMGETVDLRQREQQHRSARGGWHGRRFSFVPLSSMTGTHADAELHEYAWRYKAFQKGWRIYAKPPGVLIRDPRRRTTGYVKCLAAAYTWPDAVPRRPSGAPPSLARGFFKWLFLYPLLFGVAVMVLQVLALAL